MDSKKSKSKLELKEDVKHLYFHCHQKPDEIAKQVQKSTRTIYRWLQQHRDGNNVSNLQQSSKKKRRRKYSIDDFNRIKELKEKNPKRSATAIQKLLEKQGDSIIPSESTIRRYLREHGLGRVSSEYRRGYVVFEREAPNELWQIDIAGVQTVGHLGPIYLFAVLDDCSRFVPFAFYAKNEKGYNVIRLLQNAFMTHGRPKQLLADNGRQFRNTIGELGTKYTQLLELLDIKPIFAKPRHPQTKGKLERFFGTVKTSFLSEARYQVKNDKSVTLTDFNEMFQKWLKYYNYEHRHRSLPNRCSPAEVYFHKENRVFRPLETKVNWERWIYVYEKRKVSKQNAISYQGIRYLIPPGYAGLKVDLIITDEIIRVSRGNTLIIELQYQKSSINLDSGKIRTISQSGTIGYKGNYYNISYKMAGQRVLVRESEDGTELLIYAEGQLIRRINMD